MTPKDRVALYGRIGLILASFGLIAGIIAEPLIRQVWSPRLTVAQQ